MVLRFCFRDEKKKRRTDRATVVRVRANITLPVQVLACFAGASEPAVAALDVVPRVALVCGELLGAALCRARRATQAAAVKRCGIGVSVVVAHFASALIDAGSALTGAGSVALRLVLLQPSRGVGVRRAAVAKVVFKLPLPHFIQRISQTLGGHFTTAVACEMQLQLRGS